MKDVLDCVGDAATATAGMESDAGALGVRLLISAVESGGLAVLVAKRTFLAFVEPSLRGANSPIPMGVKVGVLLDA